MKSNLANYIVRIYRFEKNKPRALVGVVEEVGAKGKTAFTNLDELWQIINSPIGGLATRKEGKGEMIPLRQLRTSAEAVEEQIERRKCKRFQVPVDACVALRSDYVEVGQVIDIGMGGLAFRFVPREGWPSGAVELDIFMANRSYCLCKVPFKTISEFKITDEDHTCGITVKRGSVKFGKLTRDQRSHLDYFIQNHTMGEV
jgi:hypothetical protein